MNKNLNAKIEEIRNLFIESLPSRLQTIRRLAQQLQDESWNAANAKALMNEAHNLRGFSASNKFTTLHDIAQKTEEFITELQQQNQTLDNAAKKNSQCLNY